MIYIVLYFSFLVYTMNVVISYNLLFYNMYELQELD